MSVTTDAGPRAGGNSPGQRAQAALETYIAAEKAYRLALSEAGAVVDRDMGHVMLKSALDEPGEAYAGILLDTLLDQAIEQHSPLGGRLQFDLARVGKALGVLEGDYWRRGTSLAEAVVKDRVTLVDIWQAMVAIATSDEMQNGARRATAEVLVNIFRKSMANGVQRVRGKPVLTMRLWSERKGAGRFELSYSCVDTVMKVFKALEEVAVWSETEGMLRRPPWLAWGGGNRGFGSRERFECGLVSLIPFSEKLEFHFDEVFAQQVSRFMGEFAGDKLAELHAA